MNLKLFLLGTVAGLSILSVSQSNAHNQGWYVGLEGGANWIDDADVVFDNNADALPPALGTMEFDTGWAALGTIGYGFERNWRVELEFGYRDNDSDAFVIGPVGPTTADFNEWSAMANVIYDVPLSDRLDLNIGVGLGADWAKFEDSGIVDDDDWNFAYQGIVGLSYAVSNQLDLTMTYRFLNVDEPSFDSPVLRGVSSYAFDDVQKHTVSVGLRYDLQEDQAPMPPAPPAPPPAPPVEEPDQFVIFFGFNKCNITPEADQVLGDAAQSAKSTGSASIMIVGHTDTVGSDSYNQKLSECRANAAKTNLVGKGIAASSISAMGRGESELLVKTADNVKEPQNRRATIDLQK